MTPEKPIMTDAEVAAFFGIHKRTFQERVARPAKNEIDPNTIEHATIGGRRFWVRESVMKVAGVTK
ncbi:MAG: hypothetical protein IIZ06_02720 [Kiritimatiellae bacterium]|nr:hypothetical protein [Kiritimatiellia bacterium]